VLGFVPERLDRNFHQTEGAVVPLLFKIEGITSFKGPISETRTVVIRKDFNDLRQGEATPMYAFGSLRGGHSQFTSWAARLTENYGFLRVVFDAS